MSVECCFCAAQVESVEAAIDAGWLPSFFIGENETSEPVCPSCEATCLVEGEGGEMEVCADSRALMESLAQLLDWMQTHTRRRHGTRRMLARAAAILAATAAKPNEATLAPDVVINAS